MGTLWSLCGYASMELSARDNLMKRCVISWQLPPADFHAATANLLPVLSLTG